MTFLLFRKLWDGVNDGECGCYKEESFAELWYIEFSIVYVP